MTTREQWAAGFLAYAGWTQSTEKIDALVAQASKENTGAANNPLATTEPAPGSTEFNSAGVRNYPSLESGYSATLLTLTNGRYPTLVANLSDPAGGSAVSYCSSIDLNTWGTGTCLGELESIRSGDPYGYLTRQIAGGGPEPIPTPAPEPPPAPKPVPQEDEDMQLYTVDGGTGYVVAVNLSFKRGIPDAADAATLIASGQYAVLDGKDGRPQPLTPALLAQIPGK